MKYNLSELEALMIKIKECVDYYTKSHIGKKAFILYLGNGKKIKYTIYPFNLPHLLGIKDFDELKKQLGIRINDPIDALLEITNKAYSIYTKIKNGLLVEGQIFSKYIDIKLENFKNNITYDANVILNETEFVCSYKSDRSWQHTTNNQKYDYIIVKKLNDGKISLLCLVENQNQYYAMRNQLFNNFEEAKPKLDELIRNQEITLLTGINVYSLYTDAEFNRTTPINQKLEKLDTMKFYKKQFDCFIDISEDYEYTINKLRISRNERFENVNITESIINSMARGEIIERNPDMDINLLSIIDAWNNYVCNNSATNSNNTTKYTDAIIELENAKKLISSLTSQNETLTIQIQELTDDNENLKIKNAEYQKTEGKILELLKRPRM